jgi:(S)-ureidoglycine aminohydrolase
MTGLFGATRTIVKSRYALITPDGHVNSSLPGWENATCIVQIAPAMGAKFCQYLITLNKDSHGRGNTGANQYFIYVIEGNCSVLVDAKKHRMEAGHYAYIPAGKDMHVQSSGSGGKILIFQKPYETLTGKGKPETIIAHEREVKGQPFLGNEDARLQVLLYDDPAFDMAVNVFTYQPGATLPFVETHIMEHGLMMLKGQGVYRLAEDYHPVQAGDVIWMAPYCPQWFVAMGKTPASYIYYKDVNRDAL